MAEPIFFDSAAAFRKWLVKNHDRVDELSVGFYNKQSDKRGITYPEAVDEALCFGWIDGVRNKIDAFRYRNRFTPRKTKSFWSQVNIRRVKDLIARKRMTRAGLDAFARRDEKKAKAYSYEARHGRELGPVYEKTFKARKRAWAYFQSQPAWYQRTSTWWIVSAKKEETRLRRLASLMEVSARGEWLPGLTRPKGKR